MADTKITDLTAATGVSLADNDEFVVVDDGTGSVISSFPTMKWSGGSAPTLATTGYSVITIWKVGGVFYGISAGSMT